jgi:phosphoglycolate phosphatase
MAGAELFGLDRDADVAAGHGGFDLFTPGADDDNDAFDGKFCETVQQMQQHWFTSDRMENFVQTRSHPRALAGGQNDGGEGAIGGAGLDIHSASPAITGLPLEALPTHGAGVSQLPATIVFDLDGTLVDTAPDLCAALNHALDALGRPGVPADDVRHMVGHGARKLLELGLAANGGASPELIEAGMKPFLRYYAANIAVGSRPYPGVEAAMDAMAAEGSVLAICTNKPVALSVALVSALGWGGRFAANIGFDSVPSPKPDPAHLFAAIDAAGGQPRSSVFVGDSITDTRTAIAARIPVIAVSFGFSDRPVGELGADMVIDDYAALLPALRQLARRPA